MAESVSVPTKTSPRTGRARTKDMSSERESTLRRFVEIVQANAKGIETAALKEAIDRLQSAETGSALSPDSTKQELVLALAQGRTYTAEERLLLELEAQKRAFARRHELLRGALTASEVGALLGMNRQTAHDRLRSQALLAVEDQGRWKFPYWQFDANGPNGVVAGLPDVLKALNISALGKVNWLTTPNPYLEGRTPLKALQDGDIERVIDQARAVGYC
jgi:hypothetical protein